MRGVGDGESVVNFGLGLCHVERRKHSIVMILRRTSAYGMAVVGRPGLGTRGEVITSVNKNESFFIKARNLFDLSKTREAAKYPRYNFGQRDGARAKVVRGMRPRPAP